MTNYSNYFSGLLRGAAIGIAFGVLWGAHLSHRGGANARAAIRQLLETIHG